MLGAPYKNVQRNCQLVISRFTKLTPNFLKYYCAKMKKANQTWDTSVDVCKQQAVFNP